MTFNDLITRVANRTNKNITDAGVKARIGNHINQVGKLAWEGYKWSFRWREFPVALVADVNAGTATATNGSRTVTLTTALVDTTTFVGAFIRFTADPIQNWYRVTTCPTSTSLTIEPPYQQTTAASKVYELKKTDYLFPSEVRDFGNVQISYLGLPVTVTTLSGMANLSQPPLYKGVPQTATLFQSDFIGSTYSTGTTTITINTNSLTGIGTAWLANVTPGDTITITGDTTTLNNVTSNNVYTVYKVISDTSIVLYNNVKTTSTGAAYTISRQFGRNIRVLPSADNPYVIYVNGLRKYAALVNDNDVNELTDLFPAQMEEDAVRREQSSSPDNREFNTFKISGELWMEAKAQDASITPRNNTLPLFNPRSYGGRII